MDAGTKPAASPANSRYSVLGGLSQLPSDFKYLLVSASVDAGTKPTVVPVNVAASNFIVPPPLASGATVRVRVIPVPASKNILLDVCALLSFNNCIPGDANA